MRLARHSYLLLLSALLVGCAGGDFQDLDEFMAEKRARPVGQIDPIPPLRAYKPFDYSASGMRSPFVRPVEVKELTQHASGSAVKPDLDRPREFLEQFSLDSLRMVGSLQMQGTRWALVRDGNGAVHRVKVGNFMGRNHGRIVEATDSYVVVVEIVSSGADAWVERPRTLEVQRP